MIDDCSSAHPKTCGGAYEFKALVTRLCEGHCLQKRSYIPERAAIAILLCAGRYIFRARCIAELFEYVTNRVGVHSLPRPSRLRSARHGWKICKIPSFLPFFASDQPGMAKKVVNSFLQKSRVRTTRNVLPDSFPKWLATCKIDR